VKLLSTTIAAITLGLISTQLYAADYNYKPGKWEITRTTEIKGVPTEFKAMMKVPPETTQECISDDNFIFAPNEGECKYEQNRVSSEKLRITFTCAESDGVIKGTGEVNFNGKTSSGWFKMNVEKSPFGPMKIKSNFKARYIGACK